MTLSDFQTQEGFFAIAPFDHRGSLARSLKFDLSNSDDVERFISLKSLFMRTLSSHVSAVLTDPEYGLASLRDKAEGTGLFLSLEASSYDSNPDEMTTLLPHFGIQGAKSHQSGAKLLIYLHPRSHTYRQKLDLIEDLATQAQRTGVILLIEPIIYELPGETDWKVSGDEVWTKMYLEVCQAVAPHCDILKVAYPGSPEACRQISQMHRSWILLSRGMNFTDFVACFKIAVSMGCRGYAAGRAVWQEITKIKENKWEDFLKHTAVLRLEELNKILREQK